MKRFIAPLLLFQQPMADKAFIDNAYYILTVRYLMHAPRTMVKSFHRLF
jgi:hypothetical protein